ncbi:DUF116 domain-containing protein [Desulfovibrio aminophilus]|uniref:DUF116 domain-containing protein n=1 Tax=Desulfovibrio aminophilus TaxID=81425 RepID=UPI000418DA8F|nr:DUF116 domain-containing protein [Desulfovibrio aminophilus]
MEHDARKRLFVGLILGTCLLVCAMLVLLWWVPYVGLAAIHPLAPWGWGLIVAVLVLLVCWSGAGLLLNLVLKRSFPFARRFRGVTIKLYLPLITLLGRLFGIPKEDIRHSFVKVNNELVLSEAGVYRPEEILLLMPHCLQNSRCEMRLTYDIFNCKRCGKCPINDLLGLHEKYGVHLAIATGGTIARRIVVQKRPRLIVAVACDRDLASGIQDTYPLPVFGVLNERPNGPCLDTRVSMERLEEALARFLAPEYREGRKKGGGTAQGSGEANDLDAARARKGGGNVKSDAARSGSGEAAEAAKGEMHG